MGVGLSMPPGKIGPHSCCCCSFPALAVRRLGLSPPSALAGMCVSVCVCVYVCVYVSVIEREHMCMCVCVPACCQGAVA